MYISFDNKRHNNIFYAKIAFERRAENMQNIRTVVKKAIVNMAKKSASMEANTTCPCLGYQPKEPQAVKKLRKF